MTDDYQHEWVNDPLFVLEVVEMEFGRPGDLIEETRQQCMFCGLVQYISKTEGM